MISCVSILLQRNKRTMSAEQRVDDNHKTNDTFRKMIVADIFNIANFEYISLVLEFQAGKSMRGMFLLLTHFMSLGSFYTA